MLSLLLVDLIERQYRQACSPLIQLFFGFASDIDQTNINRDIRDGNWLSNAQSQREADQFPAYPFFSPSHADRHLRGQSASPSNMVHIDIVCRIPLQALAEDPRSP